MNKICTSIEQSKKLIELGLDPKTADMNWFDVYNEKPILEVGHQKLIVDVPAWSLSALLGLMPDINECKPSLRRCNGYYCLVYNKINEPGDCEWQNGETPVDAAYSMIVYLLEHGFIKTEKK